MSTIFGREGNEKFDFWLINGIKNFAVIPANTIKDINSDIPVHNNIPIRLQVGNKMFGEKHIVDKHSHWIDDLVNKKYIVSQENQVAELVWLKLGQNGTIYSTETSKKIKLMMKISPDALMVPHYTEVEHEIFFTIATLYKTTNPIDGTQIRRYLSRFRMPQNKDSKIQSLL